MATKIYNYCARFNISAIKGNPETLRRFVRVKALEFGMENADDIGQCLNEVTINTVINMLRK